MRLAGCFALAVLGACGRLGFDAGSDGSVDDTVIADARMCTQVQHDEDGDSVDDGCDVRLQHRVSDPDPNVRLKAAVF